jgi:hypothetical protein
MLMEQKVRTARRRTTTTTATTSGRKTKSASSSSFSFRLAIIVVAVVVAVAVVAISTTSGNTDTMLPSFLLLSSLSHTVVRAFRPQLLSLNHGGGRFGGTISKATTTTTTTTTTSSSIITSRLFASVTGTIYTADTSGEETKNNSRSNNDNNTIVVVTLYTKEGCTLCDKVKDVLKNQISQDDYPHSLKQIDITDTNQIESYDRYKYDIPVLHIGYENNNNNSLDNDNDNNNENSDHNDNSVYWTKHRLDVEEAKVALKEAIMEGSFQPRQGRPNAAAMER